MDLGLDIVNGVGGLELDGSLLAGQGLDKDLHSTTNMEHGVVHRYYNKI